MVYGFKKEYDKAIQCYEKILEIKPTNIDLLNNIGLMYQYKKDYEKALLIYKKVLKIDINNKQTNERLENIKKAHPDIWNNNQNS